MWTWSEEAALLGISIDPGSRLNMGVLASDAASARCGGEKPALLFVGRSDAPETLTYEQLSLESSRFAAFLTGIGIKKGDRVAVCTEKCLRHYIAIIGCLKTGAVLVPLFPSFGPEALRDRLSDCAASAIIIQDNLLSRLDPVRAELPGLDHLIVLGSGISGVDRSTDFDEYKKYEPAASGTLPETFADDPAIIHYTSGTTGKPKGAVHAHRAVLGHFATMRHIFGITGGDIYMCTADSAWVTGMSYGIIGPLSVCATQVVLEGTPRPQAVLDTIQKYKVTELYTAPTLLRMIMREKTEVLGSFDFSSLRMIASVGEALDPEIVRRGRDIFGLTITDTWFQTETGCILLSNKDCGEAGFGSIGREVTPVKLEIIDDAGNVLPAGDVGHLAVRPDGPSFFVTYLNAPETYASKFRSGFYLTGDKASRDENGMLHFFGREDDVINTAGHLVSPLEVESILIANDAVAEAAVIGVPDRFLGEKIKAFIVPAHEIPDPFALQIELRSAARNLVSPFAVPQEIVLVDKLPKTDSGKIIRRLLK